MAKGLGPLRRLRAAVGETSRASMQVFWPSNLPWQWCGTQLACRPAAAVSLAFARNQVTAHCSAHTIQRQY
jgi:hypothetical protein